MPVVLLAYTLTAVDVLIFNKSGEQVQNDFIFGNICLENVKHYRYLGVNFSTSGIFNYAQDDILKRSTKASFKLTKAII